MERNSTTELKKRNILRLNNAESNRITRECMTTALLKLMKEKPFEKITVSDIVKRAGVSRTAFYRNYSVKEDILGDIRQKLLDTAREFLQKPELSDNPYKWFVECFSFVREKAALFMPIIEAHMDLGDFFKYESVLDILQPSDNRFVRYRNLGIEAALLRILNVWFDDGMKESPEEMADFCVGMFNGRFLPE